MKYLQIFQAIVVATSFLLAAPVPGAAQAPPSPPRSASVAEAGALIGNGKFEEALTILRPLARGGRAGADVVFRIGLAAVGAAQQPGIDEEKRDALLDEAITAFHSMLVSRPELLRVRLELARAFFLKGEDSLATRHFEQVLASKPPAGVALNVQRFLAEMRARKRWSMYAGFALAPDTNIGAQSDDRIIYIQGLPFRRNQEELTSSGIGISAWAGGEYQYPLDERWRLRGGGDVWRREYRENEFDRMVVGGHVGPRWLIDRDTEGSALVVARRQWTGTDPEFRDLGLRVEARRRLTRQMTADLRASWLDRRYDESTHLDGPVMDVSLERRPCADADAAGRGGGRLGAGAARDRALAQRQPVAARGTHRGAALGLHRGRDGHAALDRLRRQLVSLRRRRLGPARPDPQSARLRPQPGLHLGGVQPAGLGGARGPDLERPTPRLRAHIGRAPLRAAVLSGAGPCGNRSTSLNG